MNPKALIPVVVGLGIGGFALKMVFDTIKKAKGAQETTVTIWAPTEEIPRGAEISDLMLKGTPYPTKSVPHGAFQKKEEVVGRVTRIAAPAGLPILDSMLLPKGAQAGVGALIKPGFRAVSIRIDESSGVSNLLQPGNFVDVVGFFTVRRGNRQEIVSRTLIENVEVAAVGERFNVPTTTGDGKKSGGDLKPARAVTLFVKPENVPELHLAEQRGKIKLSLRNNTDESGGVDDMVTESKLVGVDVDAANEAQNERMKQFTGAKEAPVIAQPPPVEKFNHQMVVINGNARQVLAWKDENSREAFELVPAGTRPKPRKSPLPQPTRPADSQSTPADSRNTPAADKPAELPPEPVGPDAAPENPFDQPPFGEPIEGT